MKKIIEFYVPTTFKKNPTSQPCSHKTKIIEFGATGSAWQVTNLIVGYVTH